MANVDNAYRDILKDKTGHIKNPQLAWCVLLFFLLGSSGAEAYLDPSTGSMVISAIVGIVASVALAIKTYWYKLKALLRRKPENDGRGQD